MRRANVAGRRGGNRCLTDCVFRMLLQRVERGLSGNAAAQELRHYAMEEAFDATGTATISFLEKSIDSDRGIYKSARQFIDGQIQHFLQTDRVAVAGEMLDPRSAGARVATMPVAQSKMTPETINGKPSFSPAT